jgi:hypothetical protein
MVWVGMLTSCFWCVRRFSHEMPYLDDWTLMPAALGKQPITAEWLWSVDDGERPVLRRLFLVGLYRASGMDLRSGMYFSTAALGFLAALFMLAARRIRGRASLTDAFFPLVLLHWGHGANLLWNWQAGLTLTTLLAGILLVQVATSGNGLAWVAVLGASEIALVLCGNVGLVLAFASALGLGWAGARLLLDQQRRWSGWALLGVSLVTVCLAAATAWPISPGAALTRNLAAASVEMASIAMGPFLDWRRYVVAAVVFAGLIAAFVVLISRWPRQPGERPRVLGLAFVLIGLLATGVVQGLGRDNDPLRLRWATTPATLIACWFYVVVLLYGRSKRSLWSLAGLVVAASFFLWSNTREGLAYADQLDKHLRKFELALASGFPPLYLECRYGQPPDRIGPRGLDKSLGEAIRLLMREKIGIFARARPDPSYRALLLLKAAKGGANTWVFDQPQRIYAIRLQVRYPKAPGWAMLQVTWKKNRNDPPAAARVFQTPMARDGADEMAILWLDDTVSELRLEPDVKLSSGLIHDIEALIPAD